MRPLDLSRVLDPRDPELTGAVMTESGMRTRDAAELAGQLEPYMADYGMTRMAHLTGFDFVGLPVHMAMKPQGRSLSSGSGKGVTPEASWVSAFMECAEQAVWEGLELESLATSEHVLDRMGITHVSGHDISQVKGAIWNERSVTDWVPGWDIVAGEEVYVPCSAVDVAVTTDPRTATRQFASGSNGLASGAHVLEAVLSGLQEVVERDGMTLNAYVTKGTHLAANEALAACAPAIYERIARAGLRLEIVDATCDDIGVPVVVAYLHDVEGGSTGLFKGAGAGTSTDTALVRAVTEAAQARCLIVAGARDDQFESQRRAAQRFSSIPRTTAQTEFTGGRDARTGSVLGDLTWMVNQVVEAGFERVIVIRHSEPTDPVQVVRVIVPGLEGYPFAYSKTGPRAKTWPTRERKAS